MPTDFASQPPYSVIQPGAYSAVNASQLTNANQNANAPIPMILGVSQGGQPNTPLFFQSLGAAYSALRGGPGYDAVRFAFKGAQQVGFCRVGNSITQATLALAGSSGTIVTLTAKDWGAWCNSILLTATTANVITLSYTDPLGNVFTETWDLSTVGGLTVAQVAAAINGTLAGYNGSSFVTAVAGSGTLPLAATANTPLAGGTDGTSPIAGDWTNGLTAIQQSPVDIVVAATSSASVHAQVQAHCQLTSTPQARRERIQLCGGAIGETVAATITRQAALASARTQLVYPGFYDYNTAGTLTLYDSFYTAALVAGMHAALADPATSLVHESVPVVQAEVDLSSVQGGAIDQLLQANVTPVAPAQGGGYWITDSLTGYTGADKVFHDVTSVRSADFVAQYARGTLETRIVGSKNLPSTQNTIQGDALDVLVKLAGMQVIASYLTPTVAAGAKVGSWLVNLPVQLVGVNKYIFITVALQGPATPAASVTAQSNLS